MLLSVSTIVGISSKVGYENHLIFFVELSILLNLDYSSKDFHLDSVNYVTLNLTGGWFNVFLKMC